MTDGTSQGLFIVVAIVIFGIFVALSYTVFGNDGLSGGISSLFEDATDIEYVFDSRVIPDYYVQALDTDFTYIDDSSAPYGGYYTYTGSDDYIIIPSQINGEPLVSAYKMFNGTTVKGVATESSTLINASHMFENSHSDELDLRFLRTSNVEYMQAMFMSSRAETIDLSSINTSNVVNMGGMFYNSSANEIDLSNFDTSKVVNMSSMFWLSKAESINLRNFNTSSTERMHDMFRDSEVSELDLSSFDTNRVTSMRNMFRGTQIEHLELSSFDTSNVTDMHAMFHFSNAKSIDLSSFNVSRVTNMQSMFSASEVEVIDLSSFDMTSVTNTNYIFSGTVANEGFARTQADADILNQLIGSNPNLFFTVK